MKGYKRRLASILAFILTIALSCPFAFAEGSGESSDDAAVTIDQQVQTEAEEPDALDSILEDQAEAPMDAIADELTEGQPEALTKEPMAAEAGDAQKSEKVKVAVTYDPESVTWTGSTVDDLNNQYADNVKVNVGPDDRGLLSGVFHVMVAGIDDNGNFKVLEDPVSIFNNNIVLVLMDLADSVTATTDDFEVSFNGNVLQGNESNVKTMISDKLFVVLFTPEYSAADMSTFAQSEYSAVAGSYVNLQLYKGWSYTSVKSSNTSVLKIENSNLNGNNVVYAKAVAAGTAVVTATDGKGNEAKCTVKVTASECNHSWSSDGVTSYDDTYHYIGEHCTKCNATNAVPGAHSYGYTYKYESTGGDSHKVYQRCIYCSYYKHMRTDSHRWEDIWYSNLPYNHHYTQCNAEYHYVDQQCEYCKQKGQRLEKHNTLTSAFITKATPAKDGIEMVTCNKCKYFRKEPFPWVRDYATCVRYDFTHSKIYPKTKTVTVNLENGLAGAVVQLKIGNKTYKKTIPDDYTDTVKFKIKPPKKYGKKVTVQLTYNGIEIGGDQCGNSSWDVVWYAKNVKKGMTKKQVKCTWGKPREIIKSSGGYETWYYWSSKYVRFKRGKVDYWQKNG